MKSKCSKCGGRLIFSPKNKGNKCESCGMIYPLEFIKFFDKKDIETAKNNTNVKDIKNLKCKNCGAEIILNKYELQKNCPYCGNTAIIEEKGKFGLFIDSILPFEKTREEAYNNLKLAYRKRFLANKKFLKNTHEQDLVGLYANAFAFDIDTTAVYSVTLEFTETIKQSDGNMTTRTYHRNDSGIITKPFRDLTVEANSKMTQIDLISVLPFNYKSAIKFSDDFLCGYILESQDKPFNSYIEEAHRIIDFDIKREIRNRYPNATSVNINALSINNSNEKCNYCLLPLYIVNSKLKDKSFTTFINGQTGKVGKLPKSASRILLLILFILLGIGAVVGISYLITMFI